jgi:acyl-CoA thioester hydrolase
MKTYCRLFYRIPFSETDAMGIVHHSNHARYMERGRVEFLRLIGLDYSEIVREGFHFPLTELKVTFKKPLSFDELIMIETSVTGLTKVRLNFDYKIFSVKELALPALANAPMEGSAKVWGQTNHCCINQQGRPVEMNPRIYTALSGLGD